MNIVIATTLISVLGAGLFGGLYGMLFHFMRTFSAKLDSMDAKFDGKFGELSNAIHALDTKFTGQVKDLDIKFTGQMKDMEIRLTDKFTAQFKEHGERLARIEAKLDIDPPAEAA